MTTLVAYSESDDGHITSIDTVYNTAWTGASPATFNAVNSAFISVGHQYIGADYSLFQGFISFDTSSIGTDQIDSIQLEIDVNSAPAFFGDIATIYSYTWTSPLTTSDWVDFSTASPTRVATSTYLALTPGYVTFTNASFANFKAAINKTGTTYLLMASNNIETGIAAPNGPTWAESWNHDQGDGGAVGLGPRLTITHSVPATPDPFPGLFLGTNF